MKFNRNDYGHHYDDLDRRYDYVWCPACQHEWQHIDFGCAHHRFVCTRVDVVDRVTTRMFSQVQFPLYDETYVPTIT